MASNLTSGSSSGLRVYYPDEWDNLGGVSEIEEELFDLNNYGGVEKIPLSRIRELEGEDSVFSFDFHEKGEEIVYVAVGKQGEENTSMDALKWTLNNGVINPSSALVFLVHVFPETKYIPTPLGNLAIGQVNPEHKDKYMAQQRDKRAEFLQKFLNLCSASQVKVENIVIESEMEAKAIVDLIHILKIRKLVIGVSKSAVRRMRSGKGNGVADQILESAPEFCEVKIISQGNQISNLTVGSSSSPTDPVLLDQEQTRMDSFACGCFRI